MLEINLIIKILDFFITASIDHWRREGIRGLWAKIALKHASLVPICAKVRNHRTIGKRVTTDPGWRGEVGGEVRSTFHGCKRNGAASCVCLLPLPDFWNIRY